LRSGRRGAGCLSITPFIVFFDPGRSPPLFPTSFEHAPIPALTLQLRPCFIRRECPQRDGNSSFSRKPFTATSKPKRHEKPLRDSRFESESSSTDSLFFWRWEIMARPVATTFPPSIPDVPFFFFPARRARSRQMKTAANHQFFPP